MFAIDDLSDAIDVTRGFLTPIRPWMWLKLALIVFFVGGFSTPTYFGGGGFNGGPAPETGPDPGASVDFGELLPLFIGIAVVILAIGLGFLFLSSLFEFTLLESLRSSEVHVRRYTSRNINHGVRLFGFRVVLGLIGLVLFGLPVVAIVFWTPGPVSLGLIGLLVLIAIPVGIGFAIVDRFTTVFVAPTMLEHELGVVAAWRRFWPTLTAHWTEYVVYLLLVWVLQLVLSIAIGILFVILLIPFIILVIILSLIPFIGLLVFVLGLPFIILSALLLQVPIVVYLRYYALLVLGDTNADLDLIPDQRAAVRGSGPGRSAGSGAGWDTESDSPDTDDRGPDETADPWGDDEDDSSGEGDNSGWSNSNSWDDGDDEDEGWQ